MDRRLTIDMFPGGIMDERALRRGDLCDKTIIKDVLGIIEDFDEGKAILQNKGAYTKHYIGGQRIYHTFCRHEGEPYRYAGQCEYGKTTNLHPGASQNVFVISQYHADTWEEIAFNLMFAKMIARDIFLKTGDIPIVPHIYFTSFLNDEGFERDFGIEAGHIFMRTCDRAICAVIDGRISEGMRMDIDYATIELALDVEYMHFTKAQAADFINAMVSEMRLYEPEDEHR